VKQAALQRQISGFARQEQLDVDRARSLTPPGTLRDEQQALVQALQFRVSGLTGLADALQTTARTKDLNRAGAVVASQMQRLLASDVLYDDLFKAPTAAELQRQGVTGTNDNGGPLVPSSTFLQNSELVTANAMASVLQKFRGGRAAPTSGGLHGTNIVSTKVLPSGTELSTSQTNTITVTADMAFQVTIEDSGDSNEVQIPVKLTIEQSRGGNITKTAVIPFIAKGEQQQVTFRHIPLPNFASQATLKIEVTPVPGEKNTSNNSSDYPVLFSA
jgi:hypothetical protein